MYAVDFVLFRCHLRVFVATLPILHQELAVFVTGLATDIIAELDEVGGGYAVCSQSVVYNQR